MAEPTQYMFTHQEVVTALIRQQGLHAGKWRLSINFAFTASNVGPSEADLNPAMLVAVNSIGLQRAEENDVSNLCVDAATVDAPTAAPGVESVKRKRAK